MTGKVLITGADGFTGRVLSQVLLRDGFEVHGVRFHRGDAPIALSSMHVADLRNLEEISAVVRKVRPDHVVHLAGVSSVDYAKIDELYLVNLLGTRLLLDVLDAECPRICSILLASSANIYGNAAQNAVLDENAPAVPENHYAVSKLAMEKMASLYRDRLPIVVVRPFNYTGVGQSESFLIPKIIGNYIKRSPVIELGNLNISRDFSDVRVVVDVYRRLLHSSGAIGETFNICSGVSIALKEVLSLASAITGHFPEVRVNSKFVRANEVVSLIGCKKKIEACIGPLDSIPFVDTLQWMLSAIPQEVSTSRVRPKNVDEDRLL